MARTPYPPQTDPPTKNLTSKAKTMANYLACAPSLVDFIASQQKITLMALPEAVLRPAATLLQNYVEEGIPVHTGPTWLR